MAIPKIIYQTFKTKKLPLITRLVIAWTKFNNPGYTYEFYDDERIKHFILNEYGEKVYNTYKKINIGAAKADFFRYAILYKTGGIYLDIDSIIIKKLDSFLCPEDEAVVSNEKIHPSIYVQWALIYKAGHPFLKRTLEKITENIDSNKYPYSVHEMTGPTAYSQSINEVIKEEPNTPYRKIGPDYEGKIKFTYPGSKFFLYRGKVHWKKEQKTKPVIS
jgi:inositol phosphorylceramide mannosyltransferase catalytic subunit